MTFQNIITSIGEGLKNQSIQSFFLYYINARAHTHTYAHIHTFTNHL